MSSTDMTIYINSIKMPAFTSITQTVAPNATETTTLDNTLFVDMINTKRTWNIKFDMISIDNYNIIKAQYDLQFSGQQLPQLYVPGLNINVKAYLKLNDRSLKFSNQWVDGLELTAIEVFGVS